MNLQELPLTYLRYMESNEPKCGFTSLEMAGYFDLEPLDSIEQLNKDIGIQEYASGFTAFSCADGEVLVFNKDGRIFSLPLIGMSADDAILVSDSWDDFVEHIETDV